MNKKKVCKKDKKKAKRDFVWAQSSGKAQLKKISSKKAVEKTSFTDVKTGHGKPATGHLQKEIGPADRRRAVFSVGLPVSRYQEVL